MRSLWKSVLMGTLRVVAYLAIAAAAGSAFDFGLAPAGAAVLEGTVAVPASEPGVSATGDPRSFNAGDSRGADSGPALAGQPIGPDPGQGFVRLPGHVLDVLSNATPVDKDSTSPVPAGERGKADSMTLTLVLNRDDQPGFDRYLSDVYDRTSKNSGHFLTQAQITQRFGPSVEGYSQVLGYLRAQGFRLVHGSRNRMTLTVRGTRRSVERAFHLQIGSYRFGDASFYANRWDPALPRLLAKHVATVGGLSSLAAPRPVLIHLFDQCSTQPNTLACLQVGLKQLNSLESSITCAFLDIVGFYLIAE